MFWFKSIVYFLLGHNLYLTLMSLWNSQVTATDKKNFFRDTPRNNVHQTSGYYKGIQVDITNCWRNGSAVKVFIVLPENLWFLASTRWLLTVSNSNFRGSDTLYWFLWTLCSHKHRLIDKIKSKIIFKGKLFVLSIFPDHWEASALWIWASVFCTLPHVL